MNGSKNNKVSEKRLVDNKYRRKLTKHQTDYELYENLVIVESKGVEEEYLIKRAIDSMMRRGADYWILYRVEYRKHQYRGMRSYRRTILAGETLKSTKRISCTLSLGSQRF